MRGWKAVAAGIGITMAMTACGPDDGPADGDVAVTRDLAGTVRFFATASLGDAAEEIAAAFEAEHPDVAVELNVAASSSLVQQVLAGSPADAVVTADERTMGELTDEGLVERPQVVAENALALVTPAGNPGGVTGLADLADERLLVGLCAPEVPCGDLSRAVLADRDIDPAPDTEEPNVRALLTKLVAGELDAGLVFRSDALAGGDAIETVTVPGLDQVTTRYPAARVVDSGNPRAADALVSFVAGPEAARILAAHGLVVDEEAP